MTQAQTEYRGSGSPSGTPGEYAGYKVFDPPGHKTWSVEKIFFNRNGGPEYVRVWSGLLFEKLVLIPVQDVAFDTAARSLTLR